jgi:DNA-binding CsgD family transcriptional regulator
MAVVVDVGNLMDGRLPLAGARAAADGTDFSAPQARARARTASGAWLVLHGTRLSGSSKGETAVMIEPACSAEVAPLIVQAHRLSARERQSTQLVLQGPLIKEIAARLFISTHTVQDHLKVIFDKVEVHSRPELVARAAAAN